MDSLYSYAQVHAASETLSKFILRQTPSTHGVVAVYGGRTSQLAIALLAILKAGFAFNIIDPKYPRQRILDCLRYISPAGMINVPASDDTARQLVDSFEPKGDCFYIDVAQIIGDVPLAFDTTASDASAGSVLVDAQTPMYVAFTSGTAGVPKAVWGSHGPVSHFFHWQHERFSIEPTDRVSVLSGLAHDPLLRDILMPMWTGCSSWFPPDEVYASPGLLYAWLRDAKITVTHLTPSLCQLLLQIPSSQPSACLPHLRLAFFGGESLTFTLAHKLRILAPSATIVNCYGSTETPQVMGFHVVQFANNEGSPLAGDGSQFVPIGQGIDGVQLFVLGDNDNLCDEGATGEICIRTPYRATLVESISDRSTVALVKNPFSSVSDDLIYRTGDYGRYMSDGTVAFVGRRDRQVKVRGFRVDLSEIDRAMLDCGGVAQFFADTIPFAQSVSLVLFVAPEVGSAIEQTMIRNHLATRLPLFMVPDRILLLPSLPRTPNGKVDRDYLRKMLEHDTSSAASRVTDGVKNDQRPSIHAITQQLLALHLPTVDKSGAIGSMDSLALVEISCMLENEFHKKLSIEEIAQCSSLSNLADLVLAHSTQRPPLAVISSAEELVSPPEGDSTPMDMDAAQLSLPDSSALPSSWLPRNERIWRAIANRFLQLLARVAPDALRVRLHRWRGVHVGTDVSIGYDTIIETAFPWLVRIGNQCNIGMRVTIIGHFRGMECRDRNAPTVVIEDLSFVGPGVIILPNVTIGRGAVVAAGSVVSASIPPYTFAQGNPARVVARCGVPLSGNTTYTEFLGHLTPITVPDTNAFDRLT